MRSTLHLVSRNKQVIPVELSTSCLTDPASGVTLFRTAISDLTERRRAEAELDRFFNLSSDLLCIIGCDSFFKRVNPACEKTLGYSAQELLSQPLFGFMHPDDRDVSIVEFHRLCREGASTKSFRNRYVRKDRSTVWLSWNTITSGDLIHCVARDVTAQVQAEQVIENQHNWLKEMVRQIPLPLFLVEAKSGTVVSMSATSEALLSSEFLSLKSDASQSEAFFADDKGQRLPLERWPRMRAANGEELNGEPFVWQTRQNAMHLLVSSRNIPDEYDQPAMAVIVAQDVTLLKQVEKSLHETVGKLEWEQELRERFVSALTHDLRTPLTVARMNAQLLEKKPGDSAFVQKISNQIVQSIDRVDRMIQDLLDANRIRAGEKLPLNATEFDLTHLVKETLDELASVHGERFVLQANTPVRGRWSKQGLRRVVENLAINAIKYGSSDQPVTVSVGEDSGHRALITVQNFGSLIPKADQPILFQQYHRASQADKGIKKGWGIGLTLVKGTVEAHGGEITVESDQKSGTVFRVVLPLESRAA